MPIRLRFAVIMVGALAALACGSGKECKMQDGSYVMKLTKTGGTCPDLPDQTFTLPDNSPGTETGCHFSGNAASCSLQVACKENDATTSTRVVGAATIGSSDTLSGTVTVTVTNSDASPNCTGTYSFAATKR